MKYKLFFQENEVGTILKVDEDFPNLFGRYELSQNLVKQETIISEYVKYSVEASKLMESDETKWLEFIDNKESQFTDLIESEEWKLVDEYGKIHKIMIPNFCDKNEIVWRWNR